MYVTAEEVSSNEYVAVRVSTMELPNLKKVSILVVDDVPIVRERVVDLLSDAVPIGTVAQADAAKSAMEAVVDVKPQIVVLDISIPGTNEVRNGIDVLKWIKRHNPSIYVVMLTNFGYLEYREECERSGAFAFLDKSREFDKLPDVIEQIISKLNY